MFLCNSQVEGVYESQVPLWFRGVLKTGCVARVSKSASAAVGFGGVQSFRLQDLELVHLHLHPYLEPKVAAFRRIFIYCAVDKNRNKNGLGIFAIFSINTSNVDEFNEFQMMLANLSSMHVSSSSSSSSSNEEENNQVIPDATEQPLSGKAFVWLINGYGVNSFESNPPFQKLYRKFQPNTHATVKFFPAVVSAIGEAMRQGNEKLSALQRERNGPTIVVAQGPYDAKQVKRSLPIVSLE
jgi:hypothetical protein